VGFHTPVQDATYLQERRWVGSLLHRRLPGARNRRAEVVADRPLLVRPSSTGGVQALHIGAAASDSDPFWCDFNPATGSQYEWEVVFHFLCDPEVDGVETLCARQNSTNDCHYSVLFKTSKACAGACGCRQLRRCMFATHPHIK